MSVARDRRRVGWATRAGVIAAIVAAIGLLGGGAASAATIQVTTTTDEFDGGTRCSLREALWAANNDSGAMADGCRAGSGRDTIVVPAGRFRLTRRAPSTTPPTPTAEDGNLYGDLDVTGLVTIIHGGNRAAVVDSNVSNERIFDVFAGGVTIQGLTIVGGYAAGGPENHGGGILNHGRLIVRNTTISNNTAGFGGGFSTEGTGSATLTNVTIADNEAITDGGGVSVETGGTVSLSSVTVASNTADRNNDGGGDGGGVFTSTSGGGGVLQIRNSLIAGNEDRGAEAHDCAKLGGAINSLGHNLIGNTNGCSYNAGSGDVTNRGAILLGLADNGGPTETVTFRKTSPAIDHGAGCPATDQRGAMRNLGGPRCDIGAWELVRCQGIVINHIGTPGADLIEGTSLVDGFLGLGGADTIRGLGHRDGLCGGAGADRLEGGAGPDRLDGGPGRDTCIGGPGQNRLVHCEVVPGGPAVPRH